jgi:hypothetical protein
MATQQKNSVRVGKYVNTEYVDTVLREYKNQVGTNSERIGKPDSLSVWFSLEDIEEFMEKAKCTAETESNFILQLIQMSILQNQLCRKAEIVMVATRSKQ